MSKYIVLLKEGRGKTGQAKTGKIRMLFCRDEDMDTMHDFLCDIRRWMVSNGHNPLPHKEFWAKSCSNLLSEKIADIKHIVSLNGSQLCMVNTTTIHPQIDIYGACEHEMCKHEAGAEA